MKTRNAQRFENHDIITSSGTTKNHYNDMSLVDTLSTWHRILFMIISIWTTNSKAMNFFFAINRTTIDDQCTKYVIKFLYHIHYNIHLRTNINYHLTYRCGTWYCCCCVFIRDTRCLYGIGTKINNYVFFMDLIKKKVSSINWINSSA